MSKTRVFVFESLVKNFCPPNFTGNPFTCPGDLFDNGKMFMKCLGIKEYSPYIMNTSTTTDDIAANVDICPFPTVIQEAAFQKLFFTSPLLVGGYSFFTKLGQAGDDVQFNLIFSPLRLDTWVAASIVVLMGFGLLMTADYCERHRYIPYHSLSSTFLDFLLFTFSIGTILCLYDANLTAVVQVQKQGPPPFENIDQLIKQIISGKNKLLTDDYTSSFVWLVIKNEDEYRINNEYPNNLRRLNEATYSNPVIEIPKMKSLCNCVSKDSKMVYLGRETDIEDQCAEHCYWQMHLQEIPSTYRSFNLNKNNTRAVKEVANLCVDFVRTYRETKNRRRKSWPVVGCNEKQAQNKIEFPEFIMAFVVCAIGWGVSLIAFVLEVLYTRQSA